MKVTNPRGEKKVRQVIKKLAELGASPEVIALAVGKIVSLDESEFLIEYENQYGKHTFKTGESKL
jgi:hypothetical protein